MPTPSSHEEAFSRDRQKLQAVLSECVATSEAFLGLRLQARSIHLDTPAGHLRADTVAGQQIIMSWTYQVDAEQRSMELAIGHHGPEWDAVVTLTDHAGDSLALVLKRPEWPEYPRLRSAIIDALKRLRR